MNKIDETRTVRVDELDFDGYSHEHTEILRIWEQDPSEVEEDENRKCEVGGASLWRIGNALYVEVEWSVKGIEVDGQWKTSIGDESSTGPASRLLDENGSEVRAVDEDGAPMNPFEVSGALERDFLALMSWEDDVMAEVMESPEGRFLA